VHDAALGNSAAVAAAAASERLMNDDACDLAAKISGAPLSELADRLHPHPPTPKLPHPFWSSLPLLIRNAESNNLHRD
jgi:hypothetical protein